MSETHAPAHARRRISVQAIDLVKGDIVRDWGVERTVLRTSTSPSILTDLIIVHFDDDSDHPDLPDHLAVPARQIVTAWRAEA
jgi:hypothetical protein